MDLIKASGVVWARWKNVADESPGSAGTRPLFRPRPRSAMYFPLAVLVAVLPGLYALRSWDLNPPGPWWGLRGLSVLDGRVLDQVDTPGLGGDAEAKSFRAVAMQPPLYAFAEALAVLAAPNRAPIATVVPSYASGVGLVLLVFAIGKRWRGPGMGLLAATLTAFNPGLLRAMQQATPTTLGLAAALGVMLGYLKFVDSREGRGWVWIVVSGVSLGLSLLSVSLLVLLAIPVVLLHLACSNPRGRGGSTHSRNQARRHTTLLAGALVVLIGLACAVPWYVFMTRRYGWEFLGLLIAPPQGPTIGGGRLISRLLDLAPAVLALAALGIVRALKRTLLSDSADRLTVGGTFCVAWLAVAALAPIALPSGPRPALNLFLLVPVNLLAAHSMVELASRRVSARALLWLAPATACCLAWWSSSHIRDALHEIWRREIPAPSTALGLHLGLDVVLVLSLLTYFLHRWARRVETRRLAILGGFLAGVVAVTVMAGIREVRFRHRETMDLLWLREAILRRATVRPFEVLAVVAASREGANSDARTVQPGGRLRFILRVSLPRLAQFDLDRIEDLQRLPAGRRIVILVGDGPRLSYSAQTRLDLETIHPGRLGFMSAFATSDATGARRGLRR